MDGFTYKTPTGVGKPTHISIDQRVDWIEEQLRRLSLQVSGRAGTGSSGSGTAGNTMDAAFLYLEP